MTEIDDGSVSHPHDPAANPQAHTAFDSALDHGIEEAFEFGEFRSLRSDVWRQFRRHEGALAGMVILIVIVFACFVGPVLLPFDTSTPDVPNANRSPGWPHIWGTDNLGRDAFARALVGGRISLMVGFVAMFVSILVGVLVGVLAGFFRRIDGALMRLTDLFLSLPLLPVLLVVVVLFRDPVQDALGDGLGIFVLMVFIIGVTSWMQTARIVRGEVLAIKEQEFILASRSIGTRSRRIIVQNILPNVLSPVIVAASTVGVRASSIVAVAMVCPSDGTGRCVSDDY